MTDQFADVPDLSDITTTEVGPSSLRAMCLEIAQVLRTRAATPESKTRQPKPASADTVQAVIEAYLELVMRETVRVGRCRLPAGWGSFQLQRIAGSRTPRQVPGVGAVPRGPSVRVKYVAGVAVGELLQRAGGTAYREARQKGQRDYYFPDRVVPTAQDLTRG